MASVNKVILVGNLGQDPEMKDVKGTPLAKFSLATTDRWKDKNTDEMKEATEWHRCNVWGDQANIAGQYLKQGSQIYVEGSLTTSEWTTDAGEKRRSTEIRVQRFQMLGRKSDAVSAPPEPVGATSAGDDDIPF